MRNYAFTPDERPTMVNFNQRFQSIADLANGLGNEYVWEKTGAKDEYVITVTYNSNFGLYQDKTPTVNIADGYSYDETTGLFSLSGNIQTVSPSTIYNNFSNYINKFMLDTSGTLTAGHLLYELTVADSTVSSLHLYQFKAIQKRASLQTVEFIAGYVNSPDPNAYPPAVSDGYTYTALGQLGAKVKIATGSYTGTGTYGASNPNSLTFEFEPKVVIVQQQNDVIYGGFPWQYGTEVAKPYITSGTGVVRLHWGGNTVSWYNESSKTNQLNESNTTYNYVSIG